MTLYYMSALYSFPGWQPHRTRVGNLYATASQAEASQGYGCLRGATYADWRLEATAIAPDCPPFGYFNQAGNYVTWRNGGEA